MKTDGLGEAGIREQFILDHRRLEELLVQLIAAFENDDRALVGALWNLFDAQLIAHMDAEEHYFIPELFRRDQRAARTLLEEHKHLRARLTELGVGVDLHTVQVPAARAFVDELKAHAAHEDKALYRWVDAHVDEGKRSAALLSLADTRHARLLAKAGVVG